MLVASHGMSRVQPTPVSKSAAASALEDGPDDVLQDLGQCTIGDSDSQGRPSVQRNRDRPRLAASSIDCLVYSRHL